MKKLPSARRVKPKQNTSNARITDEPAAVWVDIKALTPWERNPRKNDDNVKRVMESIKRFGFSAPIVARMADGEVIAGHTRLKAAEALGLTKVPVRYMDLDPADAHLLALADNRLNELSPWDTAELANILSEYGLEGAALAGWDSADLEKMGAELTAGAAEPGEVVEDEIPEPPKVPVTKLGDVWELGEHVLVCGDCREVDAAALAGEAIGAVVTDPPYGIGADRNAAANSGKVVGHGRMAYAKRRYERTDWDAEPPIDFVLTLVGYPQAIVFGGNHFGLPASRCWLVWDKENGGNFFADAELAWTNLDSSVRIKRHLWNGYARKDREERNTHPTQKPVGVMAWCVEMTSGVVFDPFLGSGTTLIACEQLGRKCVGSELSPAYCDVIVSRWEQLTGKKAVLRGS